jgi:hypothetical protein
VCCGGLDDYEALVGIVWLGYFRGKNLLSGTARGYDIYIWIRDGYRYIDCCCLHSGA